jgi:ABC-2 type transport system permease protein
VHKRYQRLFALIRKETTQLLRDRRTLMFIIALPLIELFLFAYAVSLTVYHLPTAIVDQSHDSQSRSFIQALVNSQYFDATISLQNESQVVQAIDAGQVKAGLVIPPDFSASIERGNANVLILLDGSDSFSVQSGYSAASTIAQSFSLALTTQKVVRMGSASSSLAAAGSLPIVTSTRVLYNPDLKDLWFILPAIVGMIIQTLAVAQAALIVVKEREIGTIEQILATPVRPIELILGKMIPLLVIILIITSIILGLGVFWFGVAFQGSLWLYFWLALVFIGSSLGLGLLISTVARTQKQAQQISMVLMLFSMLLSGIVYPRNAMPLIPQLIGDLLPLTYFIRISRGIITKGVDLAFVWQDALVLAGYCLVVLLVASLSFKKRLD